MAHIRQVQVGLLLLCTWGLALAAGQSAPGSSTDCDVAVSGGGCAYFVGQCQTDSDCPAVLESAAYGLTASTVSQLQYQCVDTKCGFETSAACDASIDLPTCSGSSPGSAPSSGGPVPSSQTGSATDCDAGTSGGGCIYYLGQCQSDNDCTDVLEGYGFTASELSGATFSCVGNKCGLQTPSDACDAKTGLSTCSNPPTSSPTPGGGSDPSSAPVPSAPAGSATDCDAGTSGGGCIYYLGQCQADSDCTNVLEGYGFTANELSGATFNCVGDKCGLETPSDACDAKTGLPTCSNPPTSPPTSGAGVAPAPAPKATILPSDCMEENTDDTECLYQWGTCSANSDCPDVIDSYLSTFNIAGDQVPTGAEFNCQDGKCALLFPNAGCLAAISLPTCPPSPPAPAPVSTSTPTAVTKPTPAVRASTPPPTASSSGGTISSTPSPVAAASPPSSGTPPVVSAPTPTTVVAPSSPTTPSSAAGESVAPLHGLCLFTVLALAAFYLMIGC